MKGITVFFILNIVHVTLNKTCVIDNRSVENTSEEKLHKDIMRNYDIFTAPCSIVPVAVNFRIKRFNFNSKLGTFSTFNTIYVSWNDDRLKWDPIAFDELNSTFLLSLDLWTPNIHLHNNIDSDDLRYFLQMPCQIKSNGRVLCINRINYEIMCETKMKYWPFDRQNCTMKFGSTNSNNYKVELKFGPRKNLLISRNGAEWDIVDYEQKEDTNSKEQLHMAFILERQARSLAAIIIYPSIVLTLLTATSLTLDVRKDIRIFFVCFSILCHFYFLTELGEAMPKRCSDTPIVLLYFRGSLIVTLIVFFLTSLLNFLCQKDTPAPLWIISVINVVLESRWKAMIWPRWDSDNYNKFAINNPRRDWTKFANILNSFSLSLAIVVYLSLYIAFLPGPYRVENVVFES